MTPLSLANGTTLHFKDECYIVVSVTQNFYHCCMKQRATKSVGITEASFDKQHLHNLILTGKVTVE